MFILINLPLMTIVDILHIVPRIVNSLRKVNTSFTSQYLKSANGSLWQMTCHRHGFCTLIR